MNPKPLYSTLQPFSHGIFRELFLLRHCYTDPGMVDHVLTWRVRSRRFVRGIGSPDAGRSRDAVGTPERNLKLPSPSFVGFVCPVSVFLNHLRTPICHMLGWKMTESESVEIHIWANTYDLYIHTVIYCSNESCDRIVKRNTVQKEKSVLWLQEGMF